MWFQRFSCLNATSGWFSIRKEGELTQGSGSSHETAEPDAKNDAEQPEGGLNERDCQGAENHANKAGCKLQGQRICYGGAKPIQESTYITAA